MKNAIPKKADMDKGVAKRIETFTKKDNIPISGSIPCREGFVKSTTMMKPVVVYNKKCRNILMGLSIIL